MDEYSSINNIRTLHLLRRKWVFFLIICLLASLSGYLLLHKAWGPPYAARWLGLALVMEVYLLVNLWKNIRFNHRPGETKLLSTLGAGNLMTLWRGLLTACLIGFLFSPRPEGLLAWIPGILYTLVCAADFLDGYLARITDHVTGLGERLDLSLDGLGVLAASLLAVQYGQVPAWFIFVGAARYLYLGGEYLRRKRGMPLYPLPPSLSRRVAAGLMMGFIAVVLWPVISPPGSIVAAILFTLPFLIGFSLDWLIVSGKWQLAPAGGLSRRYELIQRYTPYILRGLIFFLAFSVFLSSRTSEAPSFLVAAGRFLAVLVMIGFAGRASAAIGLIFLGIQQSYTGAQMDLLMLGAMYIAVLFLGTGIGSIWQPENRIVLRKAGEREPSPGIEQPV